MDHMQIPWHSPKICGEATNKDCKKRNCRGFLFPVVCSIGFSACKWPAKAKTPNVPEHGDITMEHLYTPEHQQERTL